MKARFLAIQGLHGIPIQIIQSGQQEQNSVCLLDRRSFCSLDSIHVLVTNIRP